MQVSSSPNADQGPHHLAQNVLRALTVSGVEPPDEALLTSFFATLYEASFRSDHGTPLRGRIVWQEANSSLKPAAPSQLCLMPPVPFSVSSVVSLLSGITMPSALLVAVGENDPLVIQGIVQTREDCLERALFCTEMLGPAHLEVEAGLDAPIELRRNRLHLATQNVFGRGPVRARLSALLQNLFPAVQTLLPAGVGSSPLLGAGPFPLPGGSVLLLEHQDWPDTLEQFWVNALILLLGHIKERRQSSVLVLTAHREGKGEDAWTLPPHEAVFPRLRQLLAQHAATVIVQQVEAIQSLSTASLQTVSPDDLSLQEPMLQMETLAGDAEIREASQFLASLVRIDGPLRLSPQLELLSFGGQPGTGALPERVYLASDEAASELTPISSRSFGPRNQALLSVCQQDPNSVGFAFTQDGDLRAMLRHEDKLIVWNTVILPRP